MRPPLLLIPLGFLLAGSCAMRAQPYTQLSGFLYDPSGAAVPGVSISVTNEDTGIRRACYSRADGGYTVASLAPGTYKMTVRKEGFRTLVRLGVKVGAAERGRVDFSLSLGSMQETVTVVGDGLPQSQQPASVGTLVRREDMEQLPSNGRNLLTFLELAAGAVATPATRGEAGQFTANGQRPNSHYFTVDGISVNTGVSGGGSPAQATGGTLPGMTAFGSFHGLASLDAIEEVRLDTSSALPEFGRLPGAQVAIVSRSGTNDAHGSFYEYFRSEKLDANDWFSNRVGSGRTPLRFHDFGATLGGPVRRDRTFFFASYEGLRLRQPFVWRAPVPSLEARATAPDWLKPVLDLFPAPNGRPLEPNTAEWTAHVDRPSQLNGGSLRVDHALTSRISLFGRYQEAPSSSEFGGWQIDDLNLRSRSGTLALTARLTPGLVQDFRVNLTDSSAQSVWLQGDRRMLPPCYLSPATTALTLNANLCESFFRFSIAGIGQVISGPESENRQRQWNGVEMVSWDTGRHHLRFGADFRRLTPVRRSPGTSISVLAENLTDLLSGRNVYIPISTTNRASSLLEEWSVFAQDTWRLSERLSLTYGLRWELNPPPTSTLPVFGLEDGGSPFDPPDPQRIWKLRYTSFAPRLGAAYRLTQDGRTVLRAGGGLYYDSSLSIATDLVNGGPFNVWQFGNAATAQTLSRQILSYGFERNLQLPQVWQWNFSVEHALWNQDVITASYVGSNGTKLLRRELGGPGSTPQVRLALATNHGRSDYQALQAQYRRRLAREVHALVSYSWSHSIDNSSADSAIHLVGPDMDAASDRGSSDFDARHTLTAMLHYTPPRTGHGAAATLLGGWEVDGIFRARSGFPLAVLNAEHNSGVNFANVYRPDLVPGQAIWLNDSSAPGGRRLNRAAFLLPGSGVQGNLGRNALTGFGMSQMDAAVQRQFSFGERMSLLARVEAFNLMNQANLADPLRYLSSPLFGESPSMLNLMLGTGTPASGLAPALQVGGARSMQLVLRFRF